MLWGQAAPHSRLAGTAERGALGSAGVPLARHQNVVSCGSDPQRRVIVCCLAPEDGQGFRSTRQLRFRRPSYGIPPKASKGPEGRRRRVLQNPHAWVQTPPSPHLRGFVTRYPRQCLTFCRHACSSHSPDRRHARTSQHPTVRINLPSMHSRTSPARGGKSDQCLSGSARSGAWRR